MLDETENLTPFGKWLARQVPYLVRYRPHRENYGGWRLRWRRSATLVGIVAQPNDDLWPMLPYQITRWRFLFIVFGHIVFRWDRHTKLRLRKHRRPGALSGKSMWTNEWAY